MNTSYSGLNQTILVALLSFFIVTVAPAKSPKIGKINMKQIFSNHFRTANAEKEFDHELISLYKITNEKNAELQRLHEDLRQVNVKVTNLKFANKDLDSESKNKIELLYREAEILKHQIKQQQDAFKKYYQSETHRLASLKTRISEGIIQDIREAVVEQAEKMDIDYVFDVSGESTSQLPFILYLEHVPDLTELMIKELNKFAPSDTK